MENTIERMNDAPGLSPISTKTAEQTSVEVAEKPAIKIMKKTIARISIPLAPEGMVTRSRNRFQSPDRSEKERNMTESKRTATPATQNASPERRPIDENPNLQLDLKPEVGDCETARTEQEVDSNPKSESEEGLAAPPRRKRGRPRKVDKDNLATPVKSRAVDITDLDFESKHTRDSVGAPMAPARRGPGRPRKVREDEDITFVKSIAMDITELDSVDAPMTPTRRGPGRPRKIREDEDITPVKSIALEIKEFNSVDAPVTPARRGPGRPRKIREDEDITPIKSKAMEITDLDSESQRNRESVDAPMTPAHRGPGRPRKVCEDEDITTVRSMAMATTELDREPRPSYEVAPMTPARRGRVPSWKVRENEAVVSVKSATNVDKSTHFCLTPSSSTQRKRGRPRSVTKSGLVTPSRSKSSAERPVYDSIVVDTSPRSSSSGSSNDDELSRVSIKPRAVRKRRREESPTPRRRVGRPFATPTSTPTKAFRTPVKSDKIRTRPVSISSARVRLGSSIASSPMTPYESARARLHVSVVPESLPCRETEFQEICIALESAVVNESGSCIYVSGTPGTGKTATVRSVIKYLKQSLDFQFVEINGMKITQPTNAYTLLWQAISNTHVASAHALRFLNDEFNHQRIMQKPVVVLMDELDQLVTKSQDVMYNFFNWPSIPGSKLVVVAIANIMDLPERTLSNKISSRLGLTRVQFSGYTRPQLETIIEERLKGIPSGIVDPDAIRFACAKVASVTGDARRALDICRRAVEIAEQDFDEPDTPTKKKGQARSARTGVVSIGHVKQAIREATSSPMFEFLPSLPIACKLILVGLMKQSQTSGVAENTIDSVLEVLRVRLRELELLKPFESTLFGETDAVDTSEATSMRNYKKDRLLPGSCMRVSDGQVTRPRGFLRGITELVESGVLFQQGGRGDRNRKIRLCVSEAVIRSALIDDPDVRKLL